ncbi:hypothetical protein HDU80_001748, partial [Chytriomyces hyalinus]
AMFDFTRTLRTRNGPKPDDLWPGIDMDSILDSVLLPEPTCWRRCALGAYSRILNKHGGYARIDDIFGMDIFLDFLPESLIVVVDNARVSIFMDEFFSATVSTKKTFRSLVFEEEYLSSCDLNPNVLNTTRKWLARLRIHVLEFLGDSPVATEILDVLHLAPILDSLLVPTLNDCARVALSKCKSLKCLAISQLFDGEESAEKLVQKLLDLVKETKIQELGVFLPRNWQNFRQRDLKKLVAELFLQHGWHERQARYNSEFFVCGKQKISQ